MSKSIELANITLTPKYWSLDPNNIFVYCAQYKKKYKYAPKDDMTPLESANISLLFSLCCKYVTDYTTSFENLGVERHFEEYNE